MRLQLSVLAIAMAASASAQDIAYKLVGDKTADADAVRLLRSAITVNPKAPVEIIIGEAGDKAVKKYASRIPAGAEGFYLSVSPRQVVIAGRDEAGTFYGVQEFLKNPTAAVDTAITPAIPLRGVIEGFYGNPWSHADRLSQFDFYGRHGLNVYIYGPKDDPFHHSNWFEPYPADKAAEMAQLVKAADANKVKFVWAMHPSNAIESQEDREKALAKFSQMYDLGVRNFSIFFDDISAKSVDAQIDYLNFLDREFVKTHPDVGALIVCPTQYNQAWSGGDYLTKMGTGLNPDIEIMWTGATVCDMIDEADCQWFIDKTTRKPFIWLNYPVNDYGQHNLLMGPLVGNDPALAGKVSAFCSNPMQYAEASKVALASVGDFTRNPEQFDADKSWEAALRELMPDHLEAFRLFCLNNVDVAPSVHRLRFYGETPEFKVLTEQYPALSTSAAIEAYRNYFGRQLAASNELMQLTDGTNPLLTEVKEWVVAMNLQAGMGLELCDMASALETDSPARFIDAYKRYTDHNRAYQTNVSRDFEGSIQKVRVQTGTLHVAPWQKVTLASLVENFRQSGADYPAGLFPSPVVENGDYYIYHDGRLLGNPNTDTPLEAPVFQDKVDEINPNRQEWHITLDPATERYEIHNSKDGRYINERGRFGVNPFSADWNTFIITRGENGKYAIQNNPNGGHVFWGVEGNALKCNFREPQYIFDLREVSAQPAE
ncbi:MAG: beta-N-acetylglucosaminidase domain-containing protein [Paramuribaculum sp.]|nr:beta-N-acetylglucosaminidase domain-containing protein [Paramuribaculum sp.]